MRASTPFGVQRGHRRVDRRIQRPVHRHQIVRAEELVQFDVVHVPALSELRGVQHGEHVVLVEVDLRYVVAFQAVTDGDLVESEHLDQHLGIGRLAHRDVDPDQRIAVLEQPGQVIDGIRFGTGLRYRVDVHARSDLPSPAAACHHQSG
jgi:hypothetical protein